MRGRRIRRFPIHFLMILHLAVLYCLHLGAGAARAAEAVSIPGLKGDLNQLISEDVGRRSKPNFLRLYRSQWQSQGMIDKLTRAVNAAFDEQTAGLTWGTTGLQLAANRNNIIENIQEAAASKFAADYDDFLKNLEDRWSQVLREDIIAFYTMNIAQSLAADTNSMSRAWLRQDHTNIVGGSGERMMERLRANLKGKYPDLELAGAGMTLGLAGVVFRRKLSQYIAQFFLRKGMKSAAAKAVGAAIPMVNVIMMLWSAYDIFAIAWDAEAEVRSQIHELNQGLYTNEVPQIYWDVMEPYVRDIFVASYMESQTTIEQARELANNPQVVALSEGLNDAEKQRFAERVAAIVREFGAADHEALLRDFGPAIRDASPGNFTRLAEMLRQGNLQRLGAWLKLAGESRYFDLYALFPQSAWDKFPPNEDSLELLLWMSQNLTPQARAIACDLPPADLRVVMEDLPPRYVSRLFNERYGLSAIQGEIARLAELPDKESRVPWQGAWAYRWAKYSFYAFAAIGLYLLYRILRFIRGLFPNLSPAAPVRRRPHVVPSSSRLPALDVEAAPLRALPNMGYRVRLRVEHALARQLRTIMWDSSQRVTPSEDDQAWILTVHLETLDEMARWIARNAGYIEIIEPEELRAAVRDRMARGAQA